MVWEHPEPTHQPPPVPLSRKAIAQAALGIADTEGIDAVSLSNVAAALDAGPKRLSRYVATKEELLDLLATGQFPHIARLPQETAALPPEVEFDKGLDCVLDGIAARLPR